MKRLVMALMLLSTAVFAGCATVQPPVHLDQSYWSHKPASLGVVIVKMPKPGTLKMGNQGLLDMGINGMMADSLTKHLNSLSVDDFREAGQVIADHFSWIAHGFEQQQAVVDGWISPTGPYRGPVGSGVRILSSCHDGVLSCA